jgi:hypothetical protein
MSSRAVLRRTVAGVVNRTPVVDIHTHLYDPAFKSLLLWGIDDLLVYHYLVAEAFRYFDLSFDRFWQLPKADQAALVWDHLFIRHSPISESCRGVLTTLNRLGLDPRRRDLHALRRWFDQQRPEGHVDRVLKAAGVWRICMTNSPFDDEERPVWERGFERDERFMAALRIDPLLVEWPKACRRLADWGYTVRRDLRGGTMREVKRFLGDWVRRIEARYLMVSLPPEFAYPATDATARLIEEAVLPLCRESALPLALMLGVRRAVNPALRLAGDGVGRSNLSALANLCASYPDNRFLVTVLSRENQQELCVLARKFRNLHVFGCWWFTNVPHLIEEITRMRLELVGLSCTPQHSDARVLDQLIYKWAHFREILARVLADHYERIAVAGWRVSRLDIERDVRDLLGGEFGRFCGESNLDGRSHGS